MSGLTPSFDSQEEEIRQLKRELCALKAPPRLTIIRHGDNGPHPRMVQMLFEWQGYLHRTLVPREIYNREPDYRTYAFRYGVEACVRAMAEAKLPSLVEVDQTYEEYNAWVRS